METVTAARKPPLDKVKPEVRDIAGYHLKAYDCPVKLNQNESPFDVPDALKEEILAELRTQPWSRYPEPMPRDLVAALAAYTGVAPECVVVANGSNSLVQHILTVTVGPGTPVVIPVPTFSLYGQFTGICGGRTVPVDLTPDYRFDMEAIKRAAVDSDAGIVFLCSPNNPTGCDASNEALAELLEATGAIVVVDEAYGEFSDHSAVELLDRYPNLLILKTLSKAFGAAGLRIGYLAAHPDIAAQVVKAKLPFDINVFSRVATLALLRNADLIRERAAAIVAERGRLFQGLSDIPGVTPYPSTANLILFEVDDPSRVFAQLAEKGILIRDVSGYPRLDRGLRVSVGLPEENDRFLEALRQITEP